MFIVDIRLLLSKHGLHIGIDRGDRPDVEVLNQEVEHVRGDEGRQSWPKHDVLDAQMEQGQLVIQRPQLMHTSCVASVRITVDAISGCWKSPVAYF